MASDAVTGGMELTPRTDEGVSPGQRDLEDAEDRLLTLSDKITLCNRVLDDLKDLNEVLMRQSLQNISLPQQK